MLAGPVGALAAVVAIQSALLQRARSGEGAFLDISLSEAAGWFLTSGINPLSEQPYTITATPDRRLYACADGRFVAVTCAEPRTWSALCDGLGVSELKDTLHKAESAGPVTQALAAIFLTQSAEHWVQSLTPTGAAIAIVNRAKEVVQDPHVGARGSVVECAGAMVPASPVRIASRDGQLSGTATDAPRRVGEDTSDVLASAGFTASEIDELDGAGIV
jgi:alpha-methylacyl-CoA racemase